MRAESNSTRRAYEKIVVPKRWVQFVASSVPAARKIIEYYKNLPSSPFNKAPMVGHLRGIDFYNSDDLIIVVAFLIARHRILYGEDINLIKPRSYTEKINWSKLFREMKVPETGNKLMTSEFIPPSIRGDLSCPRVVWHSPFSILPDNNDILFGDYYLKSNHGSDQSKKVRYPLSTIERQTLEEKASGWLKSEYGLLFGEWFYNVFQRELMLEQSVTRRNESISWNVYVFGGEIEMISAYQKTTDGRSRSTWFDRNFAPFRVQVRDKERVIGSELSNRTKDAIVTFALEITKKTDNVRVDFFVGDDGRVFLGEVTFTTLSGERAADREFDFSFGRRWLIGEE